MKTCSKCSSSENPFPKKGAVCKSCLREYKRRHYELNKESILQKTLAYYYDNKAQISEHRKRRYKANPEPTKARVNAYQLANSEKVAEYNRQRYEANPEPAKTRARMRRELFPDIVKNESLMHHYGITLDQYHERLAAQGGRCAICGVDNSQNKRHKYFHVDHDHATGVVRGLLCGPCNAGLGYFRDNIAIFESAIQYLKRSR
jgi:hypothetical protein